MSFSAHHPSDTTSVSRSISSSKRRRQVQRPQDHYRRRATLVELLESRRVLSASLPFDATYHGGALIPHVKLETIYYGAEAMPATGATIDRNLPAAQLDAFATYIVNSPFMDGLAEYNVGRGSFARDDADPANGPLPGTQLTDNDIVQMLSNEAAAGRIDSEGPSDEGTLYLVFLAAGVTEKLGDGSVLGSPTGPYGYHKASAFIDLGGNGSYSTYYAVVANGSFDSMTFTASHEIAEAVTDPTPGYAKYGWMDDSLASTKFGGEIGDLSEQYSATTGASIGAWTSTGTASLPIGAVPNQAPNYWVQKIWSNKYQLPLLIPDFASDSPVSIED